MDNGRAAFGPRAGPSAGQSTLRDLAQQDVDAFPTSGVVLRGMDLSRPGFRGNRDRPRSSWSRVSGVRRGRSGGLGGQVAGDRVEVDQCGGPGGLQAGLGASEVAALAGAVAVRRAGRAAARSAAGCGAGARPRPGRRAPGGRRSAAPRRAAMRICRLPRAGATQRSRSAHARSAALAKRARRWPEGSRTTGRSGRPGRSPCRPRGRWRSRAWPSRPGLPSRPGHRREDVDAALGQLGADRPDPVGRVTQQPTAAAAPPAGRR